MRTKTNTVGTRSCASADDQQVGPYHEYFPTYVGCYPLALIGGEG